MVFRWNWTLKRQKQRSISVENENVNYAMYTVTVLETWQIPRTDFSSSKL